MMKKIFYGMLFFPLMATAQDYDTSYAKEFIQEYFASETGKIGNWYIVDEYHKSILISERDSNTVYSMLRNYFSISLIDTLLAKCGEVSIRHRLPSMDIDGVKVIGKDESSKIIGNATTTIIKKKRRRCGKWKNTVIKPADKSSIVFMFSPPLFIRDTYCLVKISETIANTNGSVCIKLYKKDEGRWKEEKAIKCALN